MEINARRVVPLPLRSSKTASQYVPSHDALLYPQLLISHFGDAVLAVHRRFESQQPPAPEPNFKAGEHDNAAFDLPSSPQSHKGNPSGRLEEDDDVNVELSMTTKRQRDDPSRQPEENDNANVEPPGC